jgi:hypothetical protein
MTNFFTDNILHDPKEPSTHCCDSLAMLEPITRAAVEKIIEEAAVIGIQLRVTETYRSRQRQTQLFAQKATKLKLVGVHHYGLAVDFCKMIDGKPSWAGDWGFLGELAKRNGLVWGGDWGDPNLPAKAFHDWDHVQRINLKDQRHLFSGEWYPDEDYRPEQPPAPNEHEPVFAPSTVLKEGSKGELVRRLQTSLSIHGFTTHPDGDYGPITKTYVQAFQKANGLTPDGVAGPSTLKALGLEPAVP